MQDRSMNRTQRGSVLWLATLCVLPAVLLRSGFASEEEITVYRDTFGVPHIFAATEEGAAYGMGYCQAEDRLEAVLRQYRLATGTLSEVFGPDSFQDDYRQRLWQHAAIAQARYGELNEKVRAIIEAYQAGLKHYMQEHPEEVPAWAPAIEPWMCVALGRFIIWGWPAGTAGEDLERAGIEPDPVAYHGSNEWLVAPERTADNAPIALIDPHLSWYGPFRFYEARLYGGEIAYSGMAIPGLPLPSLGHSSYLSIAMTTGGPDTSDCYEVELNPDNPRQYKYDGEWRDMTVRKEIIKVKDGEQVVDREVEFEQTHQGPVVARKDGKAYVLRIPYANEVHLIEQGYRMITARNLAEMKEALAMLQYMEQNIMIGTVEGDIYYVRNGRVPIRALGFDYNLPVPGNTAQTEWQGIHALQDLVQLQNPSQGYMQNCNVSPQFMTTNSPLQPERWQERPYLFNGYLGPDKRFDNPLHQRAAMVLQLLDNTEKMTIDNAIAIAMSYGVYGADAWQGLLQTAWSAAPPELKAQPGPARLCELILAWNRQCDPASTGAVAYRYWKDELGEEIQQNDRGGFPPPASVTDQLLLDGLVRAAEKIQKDFGRWEVQYGEVYRVGRQGTDRSWPVGGGSVLSIATPRAISFDRIGETPTFLGRGGQTSTQVVQLTKPPRSWTVLPLGQSDHPDSPHYDDQAEKLFSQGKMKPTYFLNKEELLKNLESQKVLKRPAA
jgi:acyl-homoserine lactone acylase PvdQ